MRRGAKPAKSKVKARPPTARKSRKSEGSRVHDLEKRLAEALAQQTATSQILRVITSSPADLQPVLEAIAENAARVCAGYDAIVALRDVDALVMAAHHGPIDLSAWQPGRPVPLTPHMVVGRAVLEARPQHVRDISEAVDFPRSRRLSQHSGFRTILAVPLMRQGLAIGAISIRRREVEPFSESQVALLQTFADQAVIAIENARLFQDLETRNRDLTTALDRQTATAEILSVISRSPTDVRPVFETILERAATLCEAQLANLWLYEGGEQFRLGAGYGSQPDHLQWLEQGLHRFGRPFFRESGPWRVGQVLDVRDTEPYRRGEALWTRTADHEGMRTLLLVPLVKDGRLVGSIAIYRREVRPFTDAQVALVKTFADQAVIAIENVHLFTELQEKNHALVQAHAQVTEALEQQTATSEILSVISSSPTDVQPVMDAVVASAARLGDADHAMIGRAEAGVVRWLAVNGPLENTQGSPITLDLPSGRAILDCQTTQVADIATLADEFPAVARAYRELGVRTILATPLVREGAAIGVLLLRRREVRAFTDKQIALVKTFADQAAIAIENVRLFKELEARNNDLTVALDQQTATSEILGVISRSPTEVEPVFDAVVASAARLCEAHDVALLLVDGDDLRLAAGVGPLYMSIPSGFRIRLTRGSAATRAVIDRATVHLHDFAAESDEEFPVGRELARRFGHRTMLAVPLLCAGVPIGVICAFRLEVQPFLEQQIALLRTFTDQAVIAIENVRLFKELESRNRELTTALDRQTATAELLRVISQSQTDVQPVFETIADSAVRLLGAWGALVFRYDGSLIHLAAARGGLPGSSEMIMDQFESRPPTDGTIIGRTILRRAVQHIVDVEADLSWGATLRESARARGWRSNLQVPMLSGDEVLGVIGVSRAEPGGFSPSEITLLETFADQAVIAVKNARLLDEVQTRTAQLSQSVDELTALAEVGRALGSTLDLETVLSTIVSRAVQIAGTAGCTIWEYDEPRAEFRLRASHYADAGDAGVLEMLGRTTTIPKGQGLTTQVMEQRQPVQIHDITTARDYESPIRRPLIEAGHRALLGVPLLSEDQVIGVLAVTSKTPGGFDRDTVRLLSTFATQSALAIQNARLFREIADKSRQLEAASRHKSEFLANMSHELRTPLNAVIGFSEVLAEKMFGDINEKQAEYLQDILESGRHLLSLINDILDLSKIEAGRMELEAADFDLPSAIDNALILVRERATRRGITLGRTIDAGLGVIHGDERKVKQVLLNLLSNALKFTPEGGRIDVRAALNEGRAEVSVTDTGVGIAREDHEAVFEEFRQVGTADKRVEGTGLGLALSQKFVQLHGGRLWVESELGRGSTFTFTLPVN